MTRYQGLNVNIEALLDKLKYSLEKRNYKIERVLSGETSFFIEYKKPGIFAAKETISVKGVPDDFSVLEIREDNEEAWFIIEDCILALAKNPQAFKSHKEMQSTQMAVTAPISAPPPPSAPAPKPAEPPPTNCTKCGAPLTVTQEDLIVTCRYCGFTVTVATREEIKRHSMLENRLLTQQAVEAAQKYMDKGIFRVGVSKDATITNVKLRYVPFWVFQLIRILSLEALQALELWEKFIKQKKQQQTREQVDFQGLASWFLLELRHTLKCSKKIEDHGQSRIPFPTVTFGLHWQGER